VVSSKRGLQVTGAPLLFLGLSPGPQWNSPTGPAGQQSLQQNLNDALAVRLHQTASPSNVERSEPSSTPAELQNSPSLTTATVKSPPCYHR